MASAAIATVFAQETAKDAHAQWRVVADQLRERFPRIAELMDGAEHEVLAYMDFPKAHWLQIHSTNPLERQNAEIKRRTNVVGIFPQRACRHAARGRDSARAERRMDTAAAVHAA
jgi:putative transposase